MNKLSLIVIVTILALFNGVFISNAAMKALVIGNNDYKDVPLSNPKNDANDISTLLNNIGFRVTTKINVTQREMEETIRIFGKEIQYGDIALFYFSGHGVQVNGENYLLPIGSQIYSEDEIKYEAVNIGVLLDKLQTAKSTLNIIILDACRNNPFKGFRSMGQGLAHMSAPTGTLIAYATAPGQVAYDDGKSRNSPYTKYLLDTMQIPGLKIEEVFKQTRIAVMNDTSDKQVPWESSSLTGDFYFIAPLQTISSEPKIETSHNENSSYSNFEGIWEGYGKQSNGSSWSIKVTIRPDNYLIDYPSLSCGGELTFLKETKDSIEFKENIIYGKNKCVDGGRVKITKINESSARFEWYEWNQVKADAVGKLNKL